MERHLNGDSLNNSLQSNPLILYVQVYVLLTVGSLTCDLSEFLQGAVLGPVFVIDAFKEAGGSLVAPERCRHLWPQVREGAVTQLKELVPLHGVVGSRLCAAEPDGIVHDML